MYHRLATVFLLLTCGFFVLHSRDKARDEISFLDSIAPYISSERAIVHQEFLLLMEEGLENQLDDVLSDYDLHVVLPLGEWVLVARSSSQTQEIVSLDSSKGKEDLAFRDRLSFHEAVHNVQLNSVQNYDGVFKPFSWFAADDVQTKNLAPHDPLFYKQWHLSRENGVNLPDAWAITTGSPHVVIGLVDRHFAFDSVDLVAEHCPSRQYYYENILDYFPQKSFETADQIDTHGSDVLSVIAPCTDNGIGLAGVDWKAQVFAVDSKEDASFAARMFGVLWAAGIDVCKTSIAECPNDANFQQNMHPASVINASFGFGDQFLQSPPYGPVLDVIGHINRRGQILVASVGNETHMADRRLPGSAGGVISVGSSNIRRQSSYFSNFGRTVDVVAPGENILGLINDKPRYLNGTSFSSPIVTGVVALMLAVNPLLSWKQAEYILKITARPMSCADYCPQTMGEVMQKNCEDYCCDGNLVICAAGIIDAGAAVKMAQAGAPDTALIDIDDYYVPLSDDNDRKTVVTVKNWGKKTAVVRMKKTDPYLTVMPKTIMVPPIDHEGRPGLAKMTAMYAVKPRLGVVVSLVLEGKNLSEKVFHDQIEAIVELVPDSGADSSQKIYRELLPKR